MAIRIDGRVVAKRVRGEVAATVATLKANGVHPHLVVVLVGDDPASGIYVRTKHRMATKVGIRSTVERFPVTVSEAALLALIGELNADPDVHGILVQLPLPEHIDPKIVVDNIDPDKDVDGLHPVNVGRLQVGRKPLLACTPQGVMRLLREYNIPIRGRHAVVLGRSAIVGRPMSWILLRAHATVTTCHRHTHNTAALARQADILVSAVGKPGLVTPDWVKPGAVVIDVGINRVDGKIRGDVDFDTVEPIASHITPVPGGVGPMTVAMLLKNTATAATRQHAARLL